MDFSNILVVYDPTRVEQPALERARAIACARAGAVTLRVFACIYAEIARCANKSAEIKRLVSEQQAVLDNAVAPLLEQGAEVTTEVEWEKDWSDAVVRASIRHQVDLVLKSSYRHSIRQRIMNRTSDWSLIRECPCPILLVKEGEERDTLKVLAAIDMLALKPSYEKLNQNVIDISKHIMARQDAEVHFVNAFQDVRVIPDRNALIQSCGVGSDQIHIKMGEPEEVIVERARDLDASLVVIGNSARSGVTAVIMGNTVEKVLDKLQCDVLSMP
jgi:universal stress protein E